MFDPPKRTYPKRWKEMSVDLRLMFVYHGCMMVLFIAGQSMSVRQEILFTLVLVAVLASISLRHRRTNNWKWPGLRARDLVFAAGGVVLMIFFLSSATPLFPATDHRFLPWYLAGLGIGAFGVLGALKIVESSEAEFLLRCRAIDQYGREIQRASELAEPKIAEADWKRIVRGIYTVSFIIVWVAGVASFYYFGTSFRNGSPVPTATQTEPLTDHGKTVYVPHAVKSQIDLLQMISWVGIPLVIVGGLILHFVVGVRLFEGTPTLSEYWTKKDRREIRPPQA
jgi:hypothetical protein